MHDDRFDAANLATPQHATILFHARPVGDTRLLASAPQGTYLAGNPVTCASRSYGQDAFS